MQERKENRYAVCIGINQYSPEAQLPALAYAEKDAEAVHALLLTMGFETDHCCLLTGTSATLKSINETLRRLVLNAPQRNDIVVFYFAGHGVPMLFEDQEDETHSEVFLAPYDFDRQRIQDDWGFRLDEAFSLERVRSDYFLRTHSNKVLFLFDCCYSGDFFGSAYRSDGVDVVQMAIQQKFASTKAGGRIALSSCLSVQRAVESAKHEHGLFTYYLLEALSGRAPSALRRNGSLTVGSLFDYLCDVLPSDQRPVRSGVEQDAFELMRYPREIASEKTIVAVPEPLSNENKQRRLQALLIDQKSLLQKNVEPFVGRHSELKELRRLLAVRLPTGGYITITGQAGQGKSCIISKMIQDDGQENAIFHFIPFRPGPDYKIALLRNLMARMILKYQLPDWYVASDTYPALRDSFPKVLEEVVAQHGKEVIYIDGLDQLEEDWNGRRDLSFLPDSPPPGIVLVLGTRPNDTLSSLALLGGHYQYQLPNLRRQDFDLILERYHQQLDSDLVDQLYDAMQENALFLNLLATELTKSDAATPEVIIERVADNPENLFTFSFDRLRWPQSDWQEIIKPILGVLLAAIEPLTRTHIRQILKEEDERVRHGLARLGGLLSCDNQHRYALYHLKLRDYLRQDDQKPEKNYLFASDEEQAWHVKIADWCEQRESVQIWQDTSEANEHARRLYARKYYVTHLYYAQVSMRLFAVLDKSEYGVNKIRHGLNILEYAQDLDLGRKIASRKGLSLTEGVATLPYLWRYALLRSRLTSYVNNYHIDEFEVLLALGRVKEVANMVELLSDPKEYTQVSISLAQYYLEQVDKQGEGFLVLKRALERVKVKGLEKLQISVLGVMGDTLKNGGNLEQAENCWRQARAIVSNMPKGIDRDFTEPELVNVLTKAGKWKQAESVIDDMRKGFYQGSFGSPCAYTDALTLLGARLFAARQEQQALLKWDIVETFAASLPKTIRDEILRKLLLELIAAKYLERADAIIDVFKLELEKSYILGPIGTAYAQVGEVERAEDIWSKAEIYVQNIEQTGRLPLLHKGEGFRTEPLWGPLAVAYASIGDLERAENTLTKIDQRDEKAETLANLALISISRQQPSKAEEYLAHTRKNTLPRGHNKDQNKIFAEFVSILAKLGRWELAEQIILLITDKEMRGIALISLASELACANQFEQAQQQWHEVERIVCQIFSDDVDQKRREPGFGKKQVVDALIQSKQWSLACIAIKNLGASFLYETLCDLGDALLHADEWTLLTDLLNTEDIIDNLEDAGDLRSLGDLGITLTKVGQETLAEKIWRVFDILLLDDNQPVKRSKKKIRGSEKGSLAEDLLKRVEDIGTHSENEHDGTFVYVNFAAHGHSYSRLHDIAFWKILDALLQSRQWQRAFSLLHLLESPLRILGVCKMVCILSQVEDGKKTLVVWERVRQEIISITSRFLPHTMQTSLQERLYKEQIDRNNTHPVELMQYALLAAERIGASLQKADQKCAFFIELGWLLAQAGRRDKAEAFWKRARGEIHTIQDKSQRVDTFIALYENLSLFEQTRNMLEEALKIARSIPKKGQKAKRLIWLASALATSDMPKQAEQCWHEVEKLASTRNSDQDGNISAASLYGNVAYSLAKHGRLVWAERLAYAVDETSYHSSLKTETLQVIADHYEEKKEYEQLLGLVQRTWKHGQRVEGLALVKGLIATKPDITLAFCEAFLWTDDFLVRSFSS